MRDYQTILKRQAADALDDQKPLDHVQLQNKRNLNDYANRRLRHSLGLPMFHVERSWFQKLIRKTP